jgi:ATP-dependent DNA helicase RecG
MDAESFGLAQLHQLRGRVGRGKKPSECYLVVADDKEPSLRIKELEKSTDGFHLAEVDLKLRGPGEIYGKLQHGAMNLKIASLADTKLISKVQKNVEQFIAELEKDPDIMLKYKELNAEIKKYQQLTTLN